MMQQVIDTFALVAEYGAPYALTWAIGTYIVNTLIEWVTGGRNKL